MLGDPDQLTQVVDNLVGNALKYAPDGSPVRVRAGRRAGRVRIAVEDAGPGIPEAALELVFTKYYRVQRGATRPDGGQPVEPAEPPDGRGERRRPHGTSGMGLGLGLYICRRIIEAHGGRIWAENLPQGGSAFHIELPGGAGTEAPGVAEPEGGAHGT